MANQTKPQNPTNPKASQNASPQRPAQPTSQHSQAPYQMSHGQGQVKNPDQDKRLKENRQ